MSDKTTDLERAEAAYRDACENAAIYWSSAWAAWKRDLARLRLIELGGKPDA